MTKTEIHTLEALKQWVGKEVAVSEWLQITQERIDAFAGATGDHQWIHVDPARAATESPFGTTIAHGYLTLSLLPHMMMETLALDAGRMSLNYGLNRVRFAAPVRCNDRIRSRFTLASLEDIPDGVQFTWHVLVEIEGQHKPACVAEMIARRYI
jgi:acyl dehydratase